MLVGSHVHHVHLTMRHYYEPILKLLYFNYSNHENEKYSAVELQKNSNCLFLTISYCCLAIFFSRMLDLYCINSSYVARNNNSCPYCPAELLQLYFSSFETGIANAISSFKRRKIVLKFLKDLYLLN